MSAEILAALNEIRAEVRALRLDMKAQQHDGKTPRTVQTERKHKRLCDLAKATGLGTGYAAATQVLLIWTGTHVTPPGYEQIIEFLRREYKKPLRIETIWRIISNYKYY